MVFTEEQRCLERLHFCLHVVSLHHSSNNTREESLHGYHQMANTEIRLIIFFAAKDGEALYSQQKQDLWLRL